VEPRTEEEAQLTMNCSQCGGPNDDAVARCIYCDALLAAPTLPASIDALIEQKARAILQETRAKDEARASFIGLLARRVARLAREAREEAERHASLAKARVALEDMRRRLDRALAQRPGLLYMSKGLTLLVAVFAFLLGGIVFPSCVEPGMDRSLVAARLLCPAECDGCRGPGRIFTWHESSGGSEGNVSVQLCHNTRVDVDALAWSEVAARSDADLKPYRLTLWTSVPLDTGIVFAALMLVVPFLAGRARRRGVARDRAAYAEGVARLEAKMVAKEKVIQRSSGAVN
jgi:hypothetical protein